MTWMTRDGYGWLEMTGTTKEHYKKMGWLRITEITRVEEGWLGMTGDDLDDYIWMTKDD